MVASEYVHQHLESSIWDVTANLENSDGSKHFSQQYQTRLAKENVRLAELLEEEAQAHHITQAVQMGCPSYMEQGATKDGGQMGLFMSGGVQKGLGKQYNEIYAYRVYLFPKLIQQCTAQVEEDYHCQVNKLSQSKKRLQTELAELKD